MLSSRISGNLTEARLHISPGPDDEPVYSVAMGVDDEWVYTAPGLRGLKQPLVQLYLYISAR